MWLRSNSKNRVKQPNLWSKYQSPESKAKSRTENRLTKTKAGESKNRVRSRKQHQVRNQNSGQLLTEDSEVESLAGSRPVYKGGATGEQRAMTRWLREAECGEWGEQEIDPTWHRPENQGRDRDSITLLCIWFPRENSWTDEESLLASSILIW